jgi:hypothetical protein
MDVLLTIAAILVGWMALGCVAAWGLSRWFQHQRD